MTYDELKTKIIEAIKPNGNQEITARVLQDVLLEIAEAGDVTTAQVQKKGDWVAISPIVSNGGSVKTVSIRANTFTEVYDVVSSITVEKFVADPMAGMNVLEASTYALQFTTADTVGDFVFPGDWKFPEEVVIEPNTTYQVSVVNNLAVIVGWPN